MRKSRVTRRSSLPSGALSCQSTSTGRRPPDSPRSLPCTPCLVPSRCLRKYSCPLPLDPRRLERHTKRLRGQFFGLSGSSAEKRSVPEASPETAVSIGSSAPAARVTSSGLVSSWGAEGSQPMRSDLTLKSMRLSEVHSPSGARGETSSLVASCSYRHWSVWAYQKDVLFMCRGGRFQSSAKASGNQPVWGRSFS